jgi:hypothetical protein
MGASSFSSVFAYRSYRLLGRQEGPAAFPIEVRGMESARLHSRFSGSLEKLREFLWLGELEEEGSPER